MSIKQLLFIAVGIIVILIVIIATGAEYQRQLASRPSLIERRDAAIQECMALERYTIEQCIEIARDVR